MLSNGFKINECGKCGYVKNTDKGYVIVCLYVDDMLIIESSQNMIKSTKQMLNKRFDMKDMGVAKVILRMKITKTSDKYTLSQSHYIEKILGKFIKDDMNVARSPIDISLYLSKNKGDVVSQLK